MSTVMAHARLLTLTARKADLEYKISSIMIAMQSLATQRSMISEEKYNFIQKSMMSTMTPSASSSTTSTGSSTSTSGTTATTTDPIAQAVTATTSDSPVDYIANASYASSFDAELASLEAAQERLDLEKNKFETEHKAVTAEEENVQKLLDNSIKDEFTLATTNN